MNRRIHCLSLPLVLALPAMTACAHAVPAGQAVSPATDETATMSAAHADSTVVEDGAVRVEVSFRYRPDSEALQVRYQLHNGGDAAIAVFDRGDRHALLTGRQKEGEVGVPAFEESGDGDVTLRHVARPLPQPAPTLPPVPLAARVTAGENLAGEFEFAVPTAQPLRRLRWCLATAPFAEADFSAPVEAGGVEIWQAGFDLAQRQRELCTPWFDVAGGVFVDD